MAQKLDKGNLSWTFHPQQHFCPMVPPLPQQLAPLSWLCLALLSLSAWFAARSPKP
jgi:hypothetical protein